MPKQCFRDIKFSPATVAMIDGSNAIIAEYMAQGFTLTLRQLYYQFVARGLIANKQTEYKRLGSIVNDGRLAGLIDWEAIEDRTRELEKPTTWASPADIIDAAAEQFKLDVWKDQPSRVEVWIEKEALVGVIEPVCEELRLPYFACRGYSSQSEQWRAGRRFRQFMRQGQDIVILHLGDHDPSGIDMTRDNDDRLSMFANAPVAVDRLALNMSQVLQYNPPPNPLKVRADGELSDSRGNSYQSKFGDESWELDALDPPVIAGLIRQATMKLIAQTAWDDSMWRARKLRENLSAVSLSWDDVVEQFGSGAGEPEEE